MFTKGYEFITGITNLFIFITAIIILLKNKIIINLWKNFYRFIVADSLLGFVIHGIVISNNFKSFLWIILSLLFTFTINILLFIFLKKKNNLKNIFLLSLIVYSIFIVEKIINVDFLFTFILYSIICILVIIYLLIKDGIKNNIYAFLGIFAQIIGGLFILLKINMKYFDKNGIYHLFMIITLLLFYKHNINTNSGGTDE